MKTPVTVIYCDFCNVICQSDNCIECATGTADYSSIRYKGKSFDIGGQDYCSIDCLVADIQKGLNKCEP